MHFRDAVNATVKFVVGVPSSLTTSLSADHSTDVGLQFSRAHIILWTNLRADTPERAILSIQNARIFNFVPTREAACLVL